MARVIDKQSNLALALDKLQGLAENLISAQTNRQIQLGREKESRMIEAYNYMSSNENAQILELETALDSIEQNLLDRGVELKSIAEVDRTPGAEMLLTAANEGAMELVLAKLADSKNYKGQLEIRRREAQKILRHIDLFDDAVSLADPAATGDPALIEASDVAEASKKFRDKFTDTWEWSDKGKPIPVEKYREEVEQRLEALQTEGELARLQTDYFTKITKGLEHEKLLTSADHQEHLNAIAAFEVPRQQIVETLKIKTQDPAMVLARHFGPIGVLKEEINQETAPAKQNKLKEDLNKAYADLGSILYPKVVDSSGNWVESSEGLQAKLAQDLGVSLALLKEGDSTEFVAYLEYLQNYYDNAKEDQSTEGLALVNLIRSDILSFLGMDMEVPIQLGDQVLSPIEIILSHYKELERIDLEQSFHGIQISRSISPNVSYDASYPDDNSSGLNNFMNSKFKGNQ